MMANMSSSAQHDEPVGHGDRILVVDDDAGVLMALERLLSRRGYQVTKAEGGQAGLDALKQHGQLSLVIVDYWMAGVSGVEVLRAAIESHPDVPRIALTGSSDAKELSECVNTGLAERVLLKPWDDDGLVLIAAGLISTYQARRDYADLVARQQEQEQQLAELRGKLQGQAGTSSSPQPITTDDTVQDLIALLAFLLDSQGKHSGQNKRVAQLSSSLASAKGLPGNEIRQVEAAALLKDIAQIAAPMPAAGSSVTAKDSLAPELQPLIAGEILKRVSGFEEIAEMVRQLQAAAVSTATGDHRQMPLGAQILAVAETFDREMYPEGKPTAARPTSAVNALQEAAGQELSSELVQLFSQQVLPAYAKIGMGETDIEAYDLWPGMVLARDVLNIYGVPLLAAGTKLDRENIRNMRDNEGFSPLLSRIFIRSESNPVAEGEGDVAVVFAQAAAASKVAAWVHPAPAQASSPAPVKKDLGSGKPKVVVVDDNPSVVNALTRELASNGYRVQGFNDPAEGLQYIKTHSDIYAVISDYMMPGMLGSRLLAQVQEVKPMLPCIVITAHATQDTITQLARSAMPVRVLSKPWDKQQLLATLKGFGQLK